jgi:hypothetical protein
VAEEQVEVEEEGPLGEAEEGVQVEPKTGAERR